MAEHTAAKTAAEQSGTDAALSLHLYGERVDADTMAEAGDALVGLLDAIGESMGVKNRWELAGWQFRCDGCGLGQAIDVDRTGWVHAEGLDYCPSCEAPR